MRSYGTSGPKVIVLHGGPGAPGTMAPVARGLARRFRVLEPFQRRSGGEPLTVARHVADLHDLIDAQCASERPALVGHSWGAMLALAYAAAHPERAAALVLVGCGTFDKSSRECLQAAVANRMDATTCARLDALELTIPDPDARLKAMGERLLPVYSHDAVTTDMELVECDARGHHETWDDMVRLQGEGVYPEAFAAIDVPVLMLHGAADPHPGQQIMRSLAPHIRRLEYLEWKACGHYPWLELAVRDEFHDLLGNWLTKQLSKRRHHPSDPRHDP